MNNNYDSVEGCIATTSTHSQKQEGTSYTATKRNWLSFVTVFIALFCFMQSNAQIDVTGAVTGNGSYTTLGAAFTAIGTDQASANITITITGNTTEAAVGASLGAGTWTSLTIVPSGGSWTVSGAATAGTPLITFLGSDNVTVNGGGNLTFSNTTVSSTSGTSTLKLAADATNNTFNNVFILGSASGTTGSNTGNLWISTGTISGNDGNSFQSCKFGPAGSNLPGQLIIANGTTTSNIIQNSGITINNCEFYDYFQSATTSAAIYMSTGNTGWTVTNNKIYQTAPRTITATQTDYGIYMVNSGTTALGENFTVTGNTIGYASNSGTGTMTYDAGTRSGGFIGIVISSSAASTGTCNINNNIVSDIQWTSSGSSTFTGIVNSASSGTSNIININNNTIRNIATITTTGAINGISSGGAFTLSVSGNTINNITRTGSSTLYGINLGTGTNCTVSSNTISNLATNNTTSTSNIYGIYTGGSPVNITANTNNIFNLTSTSTAGIGIRGIIDAASGAGNKVYQNNTIYNLTAGGGTATLVGISCSTASTPNAADFSGNTIYSISGGTNAYGITNTNTTGNTNFYKNKIYGLSSSVATPAVYGIFVTSGTTNNLYNNIIGGFTTSAANTAIAQAGIYFSGGTTDNAYYNTVYLLGTSSGALFGSTALYASTTPTVDLRNNILVNTCTAIGATGFSTAYRRSSTTLTTYALSSNNNLFYGSILYYDGTTSYPNLSAFQALVSTRETNSKSQNPTFASTTGSDATFLHFESGALNLAGSFGQEISGYTTDFDGNTRDVSTPDIGADEWSNGVIVAPSLTSFTPSVLCTNGGQSVTFTGTGLDTVTSVLFNGSTGINLPGVITSSSTTSLTVTIPVGVVSGGIIITNPAGPFDTTSTNPFTTVAPPTIVASSAVTICSGTSTSLTATGGATYSWSPATGLATTTGSSVTASPTVNTTYTVTGVSAEGCSSTSTVAITVSVAPSTITIQKNPTSICDGGITSLTANGGTVNSSVSAYGFSGSTGTYSAITGTALTTATTDDSGVGNLPIGFSFPYNGSNQTVFAASTNGLLLLGNTTAALTGLSSNALASNANVISPLWDDNNTVGGTIIYSTTGTAPNRVLTVQWTGLHVAGSGSTTNPTINMQALLYENGTIQFNYGAQSAALSSPTSTIGISGAVGNFISVSPLSPINTSTISTSTENTFVNTTNIPSGTILTFIPPIQPVFSWSPSTDLYTDAAATVPYSGESNVLVYTKSTTSQTYTATSTLGSCSVSNTVTVTPNPLPSAPSGSSSLQCGTQIPSASVADTNAFTSPVFNWYDVASGGVALQSTTSTTYTSQVSATKTFYVSVVNPTTSCESSRVAVTVTVSAPDAISAVSSLPTVCLGQSVTLTSANSATSPVQNYTYSWLSTSGSGVDTSQSGASLIITPISAGTFTYTVTALDGGCQTTNTVVVNVNPLPAITAATASPAVACVGSTINLDASIISIAPGTATIGTGTTLTSPTSQPTAFCNRWPSYRMQTVYTAAELQASGLRAGNITSMAFNITTLGDGATNSGFVVKMGSTSLSALTTFESTTSYTTVYPSQTYTHTASGLQTIPFSTPYVWDGTSNIIVDLVHNGADAYNNSETYYTATTNNTVAYTSTDASNTASLSTNRLNIVFGGQVATNISSQYNWSWNTTPALTTASGSTTLTTSGTITYTVTATNPTTGCSASQNRVVTSNPLPTVTTLAPATVCYPSTVDLTASAVTTGSDSGLTYTYFTDLAATTSYATPAAAVAGTYYIKGTNANGCSSIASVVVSVNQPAAPTGSTTADFCGTANMTNLSAVGSGIKWYDAATAGNQIPVLSVVGLTSGTTYYASQTVAGCESVNRLPVAVTIIAIPSAPNASAQTFCNAGTVADLSPSGSGLQWYDVATNGSALTTSTPLVTGTYFVSQTSFMCEGPRTSVTVTVNTTALPTAPAQTFCGSATIGDLVATGSAIKWYAAITGGSALASTATLSTTNYYASQTLNGCEGPRIQVPVTVNTTAAASASAQTFCTSATVADLVATGTGLQWYAASTGGSALASTASLASATYYVSQTVAGCESSRLPVNVTITTASTPTGTSPQAIFGGVAADATIEDISVSGTNVIWYPTALDAAAGTNEIVAGTQITNGSTYYAVSVVGACRSNALVVTVTVTLDRGTFDVANFTYYPNPTSDIVNISYADEITQVRVFNMLGQEVVAKKVNATTTQIDLSQFASGTYFVEVTSDQVSKTVKVIKK